ncbi:MAG: T9SS type A sorting domain-containing protein [Flavobacteriia bacterium]|nr:T9SS type A sorting domain-containing protein [Flavobacteriia bacterium]
MKKGLLTIGAFLACTIAVKAQVYSENFENVAGWTASTAWSVFDADGDSLNWGVYDVTTSTTPAIAALGSAAGSASWDSIALTPDNYFISPAINLSTLTSAGLSFKYAAADPSYPAENFSVYAVADLTTLATATAVYTETIATGGVVNTKNIDLTSLVGNDSVYVVFRHHNCTDQYILLVDDVQINNTAGLAEASVEVSVFPNPTTELLNINLKEEMISVSILSADGKVVATQDVNGMTTSVNVANLVNGIYMYQITTAKGVIVTDTFVKK